MNAYFKLEDHKKGTELTTVFKYHMNNFIGDIMNHLKMKKMNEKSWVLFLAGIKHYTETGESITKETKLDLSAVK